MVPDDTTVSIAALTFIVHKAYNPRLIEGGYLEPPIRKGTLYASL
jgi:hypothetical protein